MNKTPADVVAAARAYLDTPYRHQGRTRMGLDCAGFVIRVAHDLGVSDFDIADYSPIPDGRMRGIIEQHCSALPAPAVGAAAMVRFDKEPQHMGILAPYVVGGGLSMIHALAGRGVVEHRLDRHWLARIVAVYELPGVTR